MPSKGIMTQTKKLAYFRKHNQCQPSNKLREQASLGQLFYPTKKKKRTNDTSADEDISIPEADALTNYHGQDKEISPVPTNIAVNFTQRNNLASNIDKAIFHGSFRMKYQSNRIIQRGLREILDYYHPPRGGNSIIKLIPYSPIYSVYSIYCTAIVDVEELNFTNPSKQGVKCIKCHELANCSITWKTKITNNVKEKGV